MYLCANQKSYAMTFDIEMIKKVYGHLSAKVAEARKMLGRPMTLTEKILYTHLTEKLPTSAL